MRERERLQCLAVFYITSAATASGASSLGAPGCTPFSKSVIASNHDYSQLYNFLQFVSLNTTLASLTSTATLLTPDNAATAALRQGSNITYAEGENSTVLQHAMQLQVVPEALLNYSSFYNGQVLRTLYKPTNLTVVTTMVNNTERIMLQSPGAAGTIYTAPMFACNLVIYGISGAFVPQEALLDQSTPGAIHNITQYIETYLIPGGPTVPINAIITAVNEGELNQVATAFDQALAHNYTQQLISLATSAIGVPNGLATLAKIGNQMIIDTGCSNLQPIIHDLYPTVFSKPQNLRLNASEL